jgi:hypothetical protein
MFVNELKLYIDYLKKQVAKASPSISAKEAAYFAEFKQNLLSGIEYYRDLANHFLEESEQSRREFVEHLIVLREELERFAGACPALVSS